MTVLEYQRFKEISLNELLDYPRTLDKCEEVKSILNALSELLFSNVNQELSNKFNSKKDDIVNWIEEIEFEVTNYEQN